MPRQIPASAVIPTRRSRNNNNNNNNQAQTEDTTSTTTSTAEDALAATSLPKTSQNFTPTSSTSNSGGSTVTTEQLATMLVTTSSSTSPTTEAAATTTTPPPVLQDSMPPPRPAPVVLATNSKTTTSSSSSNKKPPPPGRKKMRRPPKGNTTSTKKRKYKRRSTTTSTLAGRSTNNKTTELPPRLPRRFQKTITSDEDPHRLTNPLLELPSVLVNKKKNSTTTSMLVASLNNNVPQASELLLHCHLSYCLPDTFPIHYYARLLGLAPNHQYSVPGFFETANQQRPDSTTTMDAALQIPPKGTWFAQVSSNMTADLDRTYHALLHSGTTFDWQHAEIWDPTTEKKWKQRSSSGRSTMDDNESKECLTMARDKGFLRRQDEDDVVVANEDDTSTSSSVSLSQVRIRFRFVWFLLPDDDTTRAQNVDTLYGMPSATIHLKPQKQREVVLWVESVTATQHADSDGDEALQQKQQAIVLMALVLERARAYGISYGWIQNKNKSLPLGDVCTGNFRMTQLPSARAFLCDLQTCSYKFAFLYKKKSSVLESSTERCLVRLPTVNEARAALEGTNGSAAERLTKPGLLYTGVPTDHARKIEFGIRVDSSTSSVHLLNGQGQIQGTATARSAFQRQPQWDLLRSFPFLTPTQQSISDDGDDDDDELLLELKRKQEDLTAAESALKPKLRTMLQQLVDIRMEYEQGTEQRKAERKMLQEYEAILDRRKEMDMAWQKQLEQDMDAVCDICNDGEVTPDNQILFCEACNVAVHQYCYGIERVPEGDYYCIPCRFFKREKMTEANSRQMERGGVVASIGLTPLPIWCELCPRKQGAFIRTEMVPRDRRKDRSKEGESAPVSVTKWVHVTCAKWQGLNIVNPDTIEDPTQLKDYFLRQDAQCILCLGRRGAYHKCRVDDCPNLMHVSCARATGICEVIHGENCHGEVESNPWTLVCPEHSGIDPTTVDKDKRTPIEKLVRTAREFPPEPKPPPLPQKPDKVFAKMCGKDRRKFLADREFETALVHELLNNKLHGVHCEVCNLCDDDGKNLIKCSMCRVVYCDSCRPDPSGDAKGRDFKCPACRFVVEKTKKGEDFTRPACDLCVQPGGCLLRGHATPVNQKSYWREHPSEFEKSYFSKTLWCHSICTLWAQGQKVVIGEDGMIECSNVVMSKGMDFLRPSVACDLCGHSRGLKVDCHEERCRAWGEIRMPFHFHPTCARQAGLEVAERQTGSDFFFYTKCFQHAGNAYNLRAKLEDLMEVEKRRAGKRLEKSGFTMTLAHAARLMNKAILVMQQLGWAWRWAEWWVEYGDNWEPLLEEGETEEDMTKEELRIVDSTRETRCEDARRCRLVALSAALRNRMYEGGDEGEMDTVVLSRALRAMLSAKTLVGPLEKFEIEFFVEWLARAYRSGSRLLGFGPDKTAVKEDAAPGNLSAEDKSPKFLLGSRRLPGLQELPDGEVFETDVTEIDDFLKPETLSDGTPVTKELLLEKGRKRKTSKTPSSGRKRAKDPTDKERKTLPSNKRAKAETPLMGKRKSGKPAKTTSPENANSPEKVVASTDRSSGKKLNRKRKKRVILPPRDESGSDSESSGWCPGKEATNSATSAGQPARGVAATTSPSSETPLLGKRRRRPSSKAASSEASARESSEATSHLSPLQSTPGADERGTDVLEVSSTSKQKRRRRQPSPEPLMGNVTAGSDASFVESTSQEAIPLDSADAPMKHVATLKSMKTQRDLPHEKVHAVGVTATSAASVRETVGEHDGKYTPKKATESEVPQDEQVVFDEATGPSVKKRGRRRSIVEYLLDDAVAVSESAPRTARRSTRQPRINAESVAPPSDRTAAPQGQVVDDDDLPIALLRKRRKKEATVASPPVSTTLITTSDDNDMTLSMRCTQTRQKRSSAPAHDDDEKEYEA